MYRKTVLTAVAFAVFFSTPGVFARGRHHHHIRHVAQHKGPKARTRRVFRWLNSMPVPQGQPYGFDRSPDLSVFAELPSLHMDECPVLTAENWDDFWVDWASARLEFPQTAPQTQIETIEALGSLRVPGTFQMILDVLENKLGFVALRKAAVESVTRWGGLVAAHVLFEQMKVEKDPQIKLALSDALTRMGGHPAPGRTSIEALPDGETYLLWQ